MSDAESGGEVRTQRLGMRSPRKKAKQHIETGRILDMAGHAYVTLDNNGLITKLNREAERLLDVQLKDVKGKPGRDLFPELFDVNTEPYVLAAVEQEPIHFDCASSQMQRWFEVHLIPVEDGIRALFQDITDRKNQESELREQEERYRLLFESNPHPMWVFDRETLRFLAVNDEAVLKYGFSRNEFLRMTLNDIRPPEEIPTLKADLATMEETQRNPKVWRHRRRDGTIIYVEVIARSMTFSGRPGRLVLAHDITERLRAQEAEQESEVRFRTVFQHSIDAIGVSKGETLEFCNPAYVKMFGYESEKDLVGKSFIDLLGAEHRETARERSRKRLAGLDAPSAYETIGRRRDGTEFSMEVNVSTYKSGDTTYVVGVLRDNTERKKLEEQFRQSQKMEAIGQLAGGIAHDFNNLLTAILGYVELSQEEIPSSLPAYQYLENVQQAAERAASLTSQLLAFARRQVMEMKQVDLNRTLINLDQLLRRLIGEDIELISTLAPNLGYIKADPHQIEQVVLNLAVNARDAMPHGGRLTIETQNVAVGSEISRRHIEIADGDYVVLTVTDTGAGIPKEVQSHIFEPFFTTKEAGKGTGLGLATCHGIIKQHGGHIWMYSEEGIGTTFKVYLPRQDDPVTAVLHDIEAAVPRGMETILLVEDEPLVRGYAAAALRANGYTVLEAEGGEEALAIAKSYPNEIHLLLTDVVMPLMSGSVLSERLRQIRPNTKCLFTSGYTEDTVVRHGVIDEGIPFISKPYSARVLGTKVREALDG